MRRCRALITPGDIAPHRDIEQPGGGLLPELAQWLSSAALDAPIGTIGAAALRETAAIVTALVS